MRLDLMSVGGRLLIAAGCSLMVSSARADRADVVTYRVSLNTSSLIGHAAGPFSIAFQLTDGSSLGDANNTITISNVDFGGGAAGIATAFGGATGSLGSTVTLTDSSFLNFFIQQFSPGTHLNFQVTTTNNVDAGGTLDGFSFSILDNTGQELPTQAGIPFFNPFVTITINSSHPTLQTFAADTTQAPAGGGPPLSIAAPIVSTALTVPTLSEWGLILLAILLAGAAARALRSASTSNAISVPLS
jgi:hypothetical protein